MIKLEHFNTNIIEKMGHSSHRPKGYFETYLFIFFYSSIKIKEKEKTIQCPPGTAILYEPKVPQFWISDENRVNHSFFDFSIDESEFFNQIRFPLNTPITPRMTQKISAQLKTIEEEFNADLFLKNQKIDALLKSFFIDVSRNCSNVSLNYNREVNQIMKHFELNRSLMYDNPSKYDLNSYCKALGFSPSRASYYYKLFFNVSPAVDINQAKIQFAKTHVSANTTLNQLCTMLNFTEEAYTSRWFHKNFGMTLTQYKRKLKYDIH